MKQYHIAVPRIPLDMTVQVAYGHAATFDRLQEYAPAVTQDSGDAADRIRLPGLRQDRVDGVRGGVDGAARIQKAYQHGLNPSLGSVKEIPGAGKNP